MIAMIGIHRDYSVFYISYTCRDGYIRRHNMGLVERHSDISYAFISDGDLYIYMPTNETLYMSDGSGFVVIKPTGDIVGPSIQLEGIVCERLNYEPDSSYIHIDERKWIYIARDRSWCIYNSVDLIDNGILRRHVGINFNNHAVKWSDGINKVRCTRYIKTEEIYLDMVTASQIRYWQAIVLTRPEPFLRGRYVYVVDLVGSVIIAGPITCTDGAHVRFLASNVICVETHGRYRMLNIADGTEYDCPEK
jgi:hypothetical protein